MYKSPWKYSRLGFMCDVGEQEHMEQHSKVWKWQICLM